jgi:hypothetical protein
MGIVDIKLLAPCLVEFAAACGETLARAHASSGDAVAISSHLGSGSQFATALCDFALSNAEQNERDHAQLERAIAADGRGCRRLVEDHIYYRSAVLPANSPKLQQGAAPCP